MIRTIFRDMCALAALATLLLVRSVLAASDVSGEWEFSANYLGNVSYARVTLKVEGGKLSGTLNELRLEGEVRDEQVTFKAANSRGESVGDFKGEKKADLMDGTGEWKGGARLRGPPSGRFARQTRRGLTISSRQNFIVFSRMRFRRCYGFFRAIRCGPGRWMRVAWTAKGLLVRRAGIPNGTVLYRGGAAGGYAGGHVEARAAQPGFG
jgi:hypothetical protein